MLCPPLNVPPLCSFIHTSLQGHFIYFITASSGLGCYYKHIKTTINSKQPKITQSHVSCFFSIFSFIFYTSVALTLSLSLCRCPWWPWMICTEICRWWRGTATGMTLTRGHHIPLPLSLSSANHPSRGPLLTWREFKGFTFPLYVWLCECVTFSLNGPARVGKSGWWKWKCIALIQKVVWNSYNWETENKIFW